MTVGRRLRRFEGLVETSAATAAKPHAISELLEAVASLPEHKSKNGSGRAAASLSRRFAVSQSTVYQIRKVLKHGSPELVSALRQGEISPKTAYKPSAMNAPVRKLNSKSKMPGDTGQAVYLLVLLLSGED